MPTRHAFDEALNRFVNGLSPELRETATFPPEVYADLARAVSEGLVAELPTRLRVWATCHHARAGSRKHNLILLPRDAFFNMNPADEEKLRANYIVRTDGEAGALSDKALENPSSALEAAAVFERVPVHNQIYDVLVYTHRNHGTSSSMLFEARRMGIVCYHRLISACHSADKRDCRGVFFFCLGDNHVAYGRNVSPSLSHV